MSLSPREIACDVADAGACLNEADETKAIKRAVVEAIKRERKGVAKLTPAEAKAALGAIGQMTGGNGYCFEEWQSQTSQPRQVWDALIRAEQKLKALVKGTPVSWTAEEGE
jgi:hypothetical protein